jgi:hypothetical protein
MKIRQWLGYNEDASQYLLRPGELRILNNLQARRPGMLISRRGLSKIYGRYDNEAIYGLYRRATILGTPSDFLLFQKVQVRRDLTAEEIAARADVFEYVWMVRRLQGNQARIIDTLPLLPDGATSEVTNMCVAEDRHGRMFLFYGHGLEPRLYRPNDLGNVALPMGLTAPTAAPSVIPGGSGYFIESVNVKSGGGSYYEPPDLVLTGGAPDRPAQLKALVQSGLVTSVEVVDGGANYQSAPRIEVTSDKVGSGFRGRGIISTAARVIAGFDETKAGTVSGTAPPANQTYGINNGTADNAILYLAQSAPVTTVVSSASGSDLTVADATGIQVGDTATIYPAAAPFTGATITVTAVTGNVVTLSQSGFTPANQTVYEATFRRPAAISSAPATYDSDRRRFTATIPLTSASSSGRGAKATLEFSPAPLGYGLNAVTNSSVSVTNTNWQTYLNRTKNLVPFLYDEFWTGSDFDVPNSTENIEYGGLQAGKGRRVRGFSGSVRGRPADVYWPDYSSISVWFCTGTYSSNLAQWTRADISVETEVDEVTEVVSKVLRFRLRPTKKAKTVKSVGASGKESDYADYDTLPDAVPPEVKFYLRECPDSWAVSGAQCLPKDQKEAQPNRLPWWSPQSLVPRPIVDIKPAGAELDASAVVISDAGSGWQKDTLFAIRIYQANAYDQSVDYNTAVIEDYRDGTHSGFPNRFVEFRFSADTPDTQTPHGPPNTLIEPCEVTIPGEGYVANDTGSITLCRRAVGVEEPAGVPGQTIQWTATTLPGGVMSAASAGYIASITILNRGRNYFAEPTISVRGGGTGYGLSVEPTIENGRITAVQIIDPGVGYTENPELYTSASAAKLTAVMRPSMRGVYRCAYRFVDRTETVIGTVTATVGDSPTSLTISPPQLIEPGMVLEADEIPFNSVIKSKNGSQVELSREMTAPAGTTFTATVRDLTKPIAYSDLSPIKDVDAGPNAERTHSSSLEWELPGIRPPARADLVELWRTSADQSLVFYRLEAYGIPTTQGVEIVGTDTLTDEELFDANRPHYAAMPVVLPNGNVNAYRFGIPRADMSVGVAFQDRLWMGVSTSGEGANTLYYSEFDEFESMPDVNELPIQNNQKNTDVLTALVPFGSMLLAMQHSHTYAVAYNTDPAVDATIQMMAHRGCLHQRGWDIHENVLYAADESGIYSMARTGEVKDISLPLRDFFVSELIDFGKRDTFFLQTDPRTHILRFFCTLKSNPTDTPAFALCYDIQAGTWWTESYPNSLTASCTGRPAAARISTILVGGVDGNLYEMDGDADHANDSLTDTFVLTGGSGYREAPEITVPNCPGAVVRGVVSEGRLVDVIIHSPGWNASWGIGILCEDGAPLAGSSGELLQGVEYDAIKLDVGPPSPGGIQADAYANFSVTPLVRRLCTVSQGEDYVRIKPARISAFEPDYLPPIATEAGGLLLAQDGGELLLEPPIVEIGMEAVGDFLPLNAFVSRIDGLNIYLRHPDGSAVSILSGDPRTNLAGTSEDYLEEGGTEMEVRFYKPFQTNVPFRMATGFMQLVNDDNVKNGENLVDRSVTLVYTPTQFDKEIELIERFNGREEMRPNIMRRDRGGPAGFQHRQDSASTALNVSSSASPLGFATGVAKARFASRVYADMTGGDQHLQIELYGRPAQASKWQRTNFWNPDLAIPTPQQLVLHSLTVNGVVEDAE